MLPTDDSEVKKLGHSNRGISVTKGTDFPTRARILIIRQKYRKDNLSFEDLFAKASDHPETKKYCPAGTASSRLCAS